jgi:hypothetical protein
MQDVTVRSSVDGTARTLPALAPKVAIPDTLPLVMGVFIPTLAKGVIIRRPKMMGLAERFDFDRRAIRRMQRVRDQ